MVRAGEHQQLGLLRVAPRARRRQVRERLARAPVLLAQQPEPRPRHRHVAFTTSGRVVRGLLDPVLAEAQEREVVVPDPLQEGAGLLDLLGVERRRRRRKQIRDAAAQPLAHAFPVLDRGADVVERGAHLGRDCVERLGLGLAIGFEADERLDDGALARVLAGQQRLDAAVLRPAKAHHGVDDQVARVPAAVQDHPHRVDQERHVVGDDLDDGVGRPASRAARPGGCRPAASASPAGAAGPRLRCATAPP